MMLNITIPDNNIPEREYIIGVLLGDFLGLKYHIRTEANSRHYTLSFDHSEIDIKDSFFNVYPKKLSYLTSEALPQKIHFIKNDFTSEFDIPVIYGTDEITVKRNKIICGIDIFASAFFMLSRWEEYVNKTRDEHMRFPYTASIAYLNGFLDRPVVNEYVELLWKLLKKSGYISERKNRSFELVLTHDIDQMDYPRTYYILLGDLLKRRNLKLARRNMTSYLKQRSNPYDTFDFLMSASEKIGVKSHFYFMSSDSRIPPDNDYYLLSRRFKEKVKEIRRRGHIIGFHPGYYTHNDPTRWSYEKQLLEESAQETIIEGRQHYLRFENPGTFNIWESNHMQIDSTMGFARKEGFRCGTGDTFPVYNILERRELQLKERPLIIMDGNFQHYSMEQALTVAQRFISLGQKYASSITLLFHNTTFYGEEWVGFEDLYKRLLDL